MTRRRKVRCQDVRAAADQVLLPAQVVHPLPAGVDPAEAALAEPAAVAWRGISRVRPRPGERVAAVGDGTVGLMLSAGQLRLAALITHRSPLAAYADAYATPRHGTGPRGKVLIEVNTP
jgi:threonine dehydrogenase-like Zn-dependent dehydrogenase